jgi:hypothetical protein
MKTSHFDWIDLASWEKPKVKSDYDGLLGDDWLDRQDHVSPE